MDAPPAPALPRVGGDDDPFNIASFLPVRAQRHPHRRATVVPEGRDGRGLRCYTQRSYAQLDRDCDACVHALRAAGVEPGMRTLLMVRPGHRFIALTFALFKLGAVPVLIDPGMGRRKLLESIADVAPDALVGIPRALMARRLFPRPFKTLKVTVGVGGWGLGTPRLDGLVAGLGDAARQPAAVHPTRGGDPAAILFTTGSTGPPKGVVYLHRMFGAQTELIAERYGVGEGDIDLPCFPLFALFGIALGATCVVPDMDPSRPASCDPALLAEAIEDHGVTYSFGSPAIWRVVAPWCAAQNRQLPSLRLVLMAGAPVPSDVLATMSQALPNGTIETPYGATESLPVASIDHRTLLGDVAARSADGAGTCVGTPIESATVRVIAIDDGPIATMAEARELPDGEIGELVVKGPMVTREYYGLPQKTALAKIADGDEIWHRMGDVGYRDEQGRLWFCGRKAHRVETAAGPMFTVRCEAISNQHPAVFRSALVGLGERPAQTPVMIVELLPGQRPSDALAAELRELLAGHELTRSIERVLFHPSFPVDIRHNAKIFREQLTVWAEGQR